MKKGFTLIEILAVVLIIAILSAVALPQYSRMAERSRATEAMSILAKLSEAGQRAERFRKARITGFNQIDISLPELDEDNPVNTNTSYRTEYFVYTFGSTGSGTTERSYVGARRAGGEYGFQVHFDRSKVDSPICVYNGTDKKAQQTCIDLGYTSAKDTGLGSAGNDNGLNKGFVKP